MNLSDLRIIKKAAQSVIFLTALLVVLIGVWIVSSAMLSPPLVVLERGRSSSIISRLPSSVPQLNALSTNRQTYNDLKVETIHLPCIDRNNNKISVGSSARQVRIKFRLCGETQAELETSNFINRSSGYEATLFRMDSMQISTDYMPLVEGDNYFLAQIKDSQGETYPLEVQVRR